VHVLDDSGRREVSALAETFGFRYHCRPNRGHLKKAGNLRYGFAQTQGEFIAVFDADFVPRSDFLTELLPYFDEQDVAIVQSPQYFDTRPDMNWVQYAAASTQILFYRWVQSARDRSDAAICVGTCALYRRAALEQAGGFAAIGHSEDVHTGINVTRAGYRVRYVPTVVSKGLCPEELPQFLTQQYRWCTGSMSLLGSPGFHRMSMTGMQRLSYWSGFLYYISTALDPFVVWLPPFLMAAFSPSEVRVRNYIFVFLALVVRQAVVPIITLRRDSQLSLTRIQTAYAYAHAVAIYDALRGRTDAWVATGVASGSATSARVVRLVRWWLVVSQGSLAILIVWRGVQYGWAGYVAMAAFVLLNVMVVAPIAWAKTGLPSWADPMTLKRGLRLTSGEA
jgi:cellulose synthase/poly-beta-1,6-N-acetylglucosamine synthase-like glycosyltransferase